MLKKLTSTDSFTLMAQRTGLQKAIDESKRIKGKSLYNSFTDEEKKDCARRLESEGRVKNMLMKAEEKGVSKAKIITFMKKKGISEAAIIEAYREYYEGNNMYECSFNQRPIGFSVIKDNDGKNAIISSVQDDSNRTGPLKVGSRIQEVHHKRVVNMQHKEILKIIARQPTPFYVVLKEV